MLLETERLFLRELTNEDFDALYSVLADPEIMMHYPYVFDETRVRGWITRNMERYRTLGFGLWAVCLKEDGQVIGDCGLTMQDIGGTIRPEIGYHIRRDMQRKGYAREAALAVRNWTFEHTPFEEIYSYMKSTNRPSALCAQSWGCRLAFEYDHVENGRTSVYVIKKSDWLKEKQDTFPGCDMLVNLQKLPEIACGKNIKIKRAFVGDKARITEFIRQHFSEGWIYEMEHALMADVSRCFVATENGELLGFACYDATAKGYFGPIGVHEGRRGENIGQALLVRTLQAMYESGYQYAIIGWVNEAENFYRKTIGAEYIQGGEPQNTVYSNMISF